MVTSVDVSELTKDELLIHVKVLEHNNNSKDDAINRLISQVNTQNKNMDTIAKLVSLLEE